MSVNELHLEFPLRTRHETLRALCAMLSAILVSCAFGSAAFFGVSHLLTKPYRAAVPLVEAQPEKGSWNVEGALTEACTCAVPCTCNFGMGPSPHDYCYALYSYDIRKGSYNDVNLDGLHFGAADLRSGRTVFIDERANEKQREALRVILARVIERASPEEAEAKAKEMVTEVRYVNIKQEHDARRNRLEVAGVGEFAADYIMGLDKTQPLVVRNNTTWRIKDAIKARTSGFRVKVGKDIINTKNTNSNQGDYEYSDKTDFGAPAKWNCAGCASGNAQHGKGEAMCGM